MTADISYTGQPYWKVASRYHKMRDVNPAIRATAVSEMLMMQSKTASNGVQKKLKAFIAVNHNQSPPVEPRKA